VKDMELNNFIDPDRDTIIDESIKCPKCKNNKSLKMNKFSYNIEGKDYNKEIEIGCTDCWFMFKMDNIKISQEEYTTVHKRLRFSNIE
jgi:predicted Zn-ribbon and HTH transcriptional regulator